MSTDLIAIGGLFALVGGMGTWYARGLAEHDKKTGHFGLTWYDTLETESWRVALYRLTFAGVGLLGLALLGYGVVTLVG